MALMTVFPSYNLTMECYSRLYSYFDARRSFNAWMHPEPAMGRVVHRGSYCAVFLVCFDSGESVGEILAKLFARYLVSCGNNWFVKAVKITNLRQWAIGRMRILSHTKVTLICGNIKVFFKPSVLPGRLPFRELGTRGPGQGGRSSSLGEKAKAQSLFAYKEAEDEENCSLCYQSNNKTGTEEEEK